MDHPPSKSEFEISIFGPGYGESVLLHLGDNTWIIVDSCIDQLSGYPAPLKYLHDIGVDPSTFIKLIIATHWHDDHIRGLSKILEECKAADFCCSSAIRTKEFLKLVSLYSKGSMMTTSGVDEISSVLNIITKRNNFLRLASENKCLMRVKSNSSTGTLNYEIHALSPSDKSVTTAIQEIAQLIPKAKTSKKRVLSQSPNHVAIVLQIILENVCLLLGADLEDTNDPNTGWTNIVKSKIRIKRNASVFKIPHHGSENAHNDNVWGELLETNPIALLTPFLKGNIYLPKKQDVSRIVKNTNRAYITAKPEWGKRIKRSRTVDKTIKETVRSIKTINNEIGQVSIRCKISNTKNQFRIKLSENALLLSNIQL